MMNKRCSLHMLINVINDIFRRKFSDALNEFIIIIRICLAHTKEEKRIKKIRFSLSQSVFLFFLDNYDL